MPEFRNQSGTIGDDLGAGRFRAEQAAALRIFGLGSHFTMAELQLQFDRVVARHQVGSDDYVYVVDCFNLLRNYLDPDTYNRYGGLGHRGRDAEQEP